MKEKRVKEKEIVKPSLRIIKDNPGINTSELIEELQKMIELYPGDKETLNGRSDNKFSQIVRNLISHKENNKFGKCVYSKKEGRNGGFYINEEGENEIKGYEKREIKEEAEDNKLQREIRESNAYENIDDLNRANSRLPEKKTKSSNSKYKTDPRISKTVLKENGLSTLFCTIFIRTFFYIQLVINNLMNCELLYYYTN